MAAFNLTDIYNLLQPKLATFKPSTFYEYTLLDPSETNGSTYYIYDGGHDMYDSGNYTTIRNDTTNSSNLNYNTTTSTQISVTSNVNYISLGYDHPLIMLATSTTKGKWGFRKYGNLGSDNQTGSSVEIYTLYEDSTINGYTVYAYSVNWWLATTSTNDPTITDVFFHIGTSDSTFHSTPVTYNSPIADDYEAYMTMETTNTLFGCILLSTHSATNKPVVTTLTAQQTVITNLVNSLSKVTPTLGNFDMTRTFGDSSFTITQPSSASSGAFTYSITAGSNIISISGTTITILKAGSATVQASQAASGNYLAATKTATITINKATPTLVTSQNTFYRKFVSGASISFDVISSNAGTVSRTHVSNNTSVVTIPTASTPSATIAGPGKTTIKVTQPATGNYAEIINNALITIVVTGQGSTYTSEIFPASFDLSGTNLSNSTFTDCTFTSTNLFGITVDASTNFSTCTFTGIGSGRIIGKTARLPAGFTMI